MDDMSTMQHDPAAAPASAVLEHLLVFPDRDVAEAVAASFDRHDYASVRVLRDALAGEDDADDVEWAVHVVDERASPDEATERTRMQALATDNGGWYDGSGDDDEAG